LATLTELVDMTNRLLYAAAPFKHKRMWKPLEIPRPYTTRKERRKLSTPSEVRSFFKGASGKVSTNDGDSA